MQNPSVNLAEAVQPATAVGWLICVFMCWLSYFVYVNKKKCKSELVLFFIFVLITSLGIGEVCSYLNMLFEKATFAEKLSPRNAEWTVWLAAWPMILVSARFLTVSYKDSILKKIDYNDASESEGKGGLILCVFVVLLKLSTFGICLLLTKIFPGFFAEFSLCVAWIATSWLPGLGLAFVLLIFLVLTGEIFNSRGPQFTRESEGYGGMSTNSELPSGLRDASSNYNSPTCKDTYSQDGPADGPSK